MERIRVETRRLTLLAVLLAVIVAMSALEHMLPPLPMLPPGVRLGLSNVVTMYALFFLGAGPAAGLAALKSLFVFLMRGAAAGLLSLCGGMLSIAVILTLSALFGQRISYFMLSVAGAVTHNIGQLTAASLVLQTELVLYYLPALIVSGVVMGSVTGVLLRVVLPLFDRVTGKNGVHRQPSREHYK